MEKENEIEPVEVYAGDFVDAELLKSMMEDAEIETFLIDEITGTLAPSVAAPGGVGPVKVLVASTDYEKAMEVVREFEKNLKG